MLYVRQVAITVWGPLADPAADRAAIDAAIKELTLKAQNGLSCNKCASKEQVAAVAVAWALKWFKTKGHFRFVYATPEELQNLGVRVSYDPGVSGLQVLDGSHVNLWLQPAKIPDLLTVLRQHTPMPIVIQSSELKRLARTATIASQIQIPTGHWLLLP